MDRDTVLETSSVLLLEDTSELRHGEFTPPPEFCSVSFLGTGRNKKEKKKRGSFCSSRELLGTKRRKFSWSWGVKPKWVKGADVARCCYFE